MPNNQDPKGIYEVVGRFASFSKAFEDLFGGAEPLKVIARAPKLVNVVVKK